MAETDELFDLKNFFFLGNYQGAINEGASVRPRTEQQRTERDVFVYRSYIAQGNYQLVLDEVNKSAAPALQAVKLLASYLSSKEPVDSVISTLKGWLADITTATATTQLIAAMVFYHERNIDEALKVLHQSTSLEGHALLLQLYLKLDRPDIAEKHYRAMETLDADATLTQLANAWLNIAIGGDKYQEASYIFQELLDKYGATPLLLNGLAVYNLHTRKYEEAEKQLLEALEKNPKDPETLINLIACHQQLRKTDLVNRYTNQLKTAAPKHPWVVDLASAEENFERSALRV